MNTATRTRVARPGAGTEDELLRRFQSRGSAEMSYADCCELEAVLKAGSPALADLSPLRIAVLRNFTVEPVLPVLAAEAVGAGFRPEFYVGDFDAIAAQVLDEKSELYSFGPDFIVMAQWLESLAPKLTNRFLTLNPAQVDEVVEDVRDRQVTLLAALRRRTSAPVLVNNHPIPPAPTLGILDAQRDGGEVATLLRLNAGILQDSRTVSDVYVIDLMRILATIGTSKAIDQRYWQIGRAPLTHAALMAYGAECGRFFRALRGRSRKCLVLDCDNTLWGGVIGEDGLSGIRLGSMYPGSCFRALQEEIVNLHQRGVLIALCTKNNEADVQEVFRNHPEMVLREEHLATMMVNWNDKVTNLRQIAADLNIGLDSLVFVDDNPFECNYVREHLPEVAVIELSKNPSGFRAQLATCGLFDSLTYSEEDKKRTEMYRVAGERRRLQQSASSLSEYLAGLETRADIDRPGTTELPRVAQLTQKTNQFNLTTKRYSEGEIAAIDRSADKEIWRLSATDKVSDLGLVGVAILSYNGGSAEVETLLMSCRALGRGLEDAFVRKLAARARARGSSKVIGRYKPTAKNAQCAEFYARNGFRAVAQSDAGTVWELAHDDPLPEFPTWISEVKEDLRVS
jgi:FkbH-like protein